MSIINKFWRIFWTLLTSFYIFYFFIYWLCICIMHTCEVQKATCRSHFSSSTMLSMRIELPLPDLMANAFSLPLFLFIYLLVYLFTCKVSLYSLAWPLAFYEGQVVLKFTAVFLPWPPEFWDFQVWVPCSAYNFPMSKITLKLKYIYTTVKWGSGNSRW